MTKVAGLILFLFISICANAQQSRTKDLLQGTWTLRGIKSLPSFSYYSIEMRDSFKFSNILEDSVIQLIFNGNSLTIKDNSRYLHQIKQYEYEIQDDNLWISIWPTDKKKKDKFRKNIRLSYITNTSLALEERMFDDSKTIINSLENHLYFAKKPDQTVKEEQNKFSGHWYLIKQNSITKSIWGKDTIFLQREPSYVERTVDINRFGDTLSTTSKQRILHFNAQAFRLIDSVSTETHKSEIPEYQTGKPVYELFASSIPHSLKLEFTIIFHENSILELWPTNSDLSTMYFHYTFDKDSVILTKQEN